MSFVYGYSGSVGRVVCFFFQAEDGIRDLVRSRGLGDVYKRQVFYGDQPNCSLRNRYRSGGMAACCRCCNECFAASLSLIHI